MGPLGILGGGQLGRMTLQAASALGIDVVIAEREPRSPAARLTDRSVVFEHGWDDQQKLEELTRAAPIITLENEFVDAAVLRQLEQRGSRVLPPPACVAAVQDKLLQKQALAAAELPVPRFCAISDPRELNRIGDELGWPVMLKARRDGYDGRGNARVANAEHAFDAFQRLGGPTRRLFAEEVVSFERELAVIVVRDLSGATAVYPVVETRQDQHLHICTTVLAPAQLPMGVSEEAAAIARGAVQAVDGVGAFGIELFLLPDGRVCINELAPRPHNSGHYTIEACSTSQFANHVRAVLGLPLGETRMRASAAAMVNLLGSGRSDTPVTDLAHALATPETYVHLYGKAENRAGRKLGHVTALGATPNQALERAESAANRIRL